MYQNLSKICSLDSLLETIHWPLIDRPNSIGFIVMQPLPKTDHERGCLKQSEHNVLLVSPNARFGKGKKKTGV